MKKVVTGMIVLTLVLAVVSIAANKEGGSMVEGEGFKIDVPSLDVKVKQGEIKTVTIKLKRDENFKQDVTLEFKLSKADQKGITLEPGKVLVKASDNPEVQLTITALKEAALGEYTVSVTGTPTTGEVASAEFNVKVVAP